MKGVSNMYLLVFLLAIWACNNSNKSNQTEETHNMNSNDEHPHVHDFVCPMHPEVDGHEGEKCPKCGMTLELKNISGEKKNIQLHFSSNPSEINAQEEVQLFFMPVNLENKSQLVPLETTHEKKIHLIVVSEDLKWFDHIHPEYQSDGSYMVKIKFPNGGNFILYADFKPFGTDHQLERFNIKVNGKMIVAKRFTQVSLNDKKGDFSVSLKPDDKEFIANTAIHFDGVFTKNNKTFDVNQLQNYLGAKGHMVAIHVESKEYMHLHPEIEGNILHFHALFEKTGFYHVWLQFKAEGNLYTSDFVIHVIDGKSTIDKNQ